MAAAALRAALLATALCLAAAGASEPSERLFGAAQPDVLHLDEGSFDSMVQPMRGDRTWMVEFYAPWCPHCQELAPLWQETALAAKVRGWGVIVASVDCVANGRLCDRFGVRSYPTIRLLKESVGKVYSFDGTRSFEAFEKFATQAPTQSPSDFPPPLTPADGRSVDSYLMAAKNFVHVNPRLSVVYGLALLVVVFGAIYALQERAADEEMQSKLV